jgi:cell division protein FtsL
VSTRAAPGRGAAAASRAAPGRGAASAEPRRRAAPAPQPRPRPRPVPRTAPRRAARPRTRVRLGRLAIPLIALVLGGIVFVNVAKLTLTNQTGQVIERARSVESETARLQSALEQRNARVRQNAQRRLGMGSPSGDSVTYLDAGKTPAAATP